MPCKLNFYLPKIPCKQDKKSKQKQNLPKAHHKHNKNPHKNNKTTQKHQKEIFRLLRKLNMTTKNSNHLYLPPLFV
ncbi:hypothetical protein [Helicobacter sp. T3_23-1059]